jgi:hypothetical protein
MEELILKAMSYLLVFSLERHNKENQRRKREEAIKNQ